MSQMDPLVYSKQSNEETQKERTELLLKMKTVTRLVKDLNGALESKQYDVYAASVQESVSLNREILLEFRFILTPKL